MKVAALEKRIAELEAEIAKLKAQPRSVIEYHYHQQAQPYYAPYPQPYPSYPWVTWGGASTTGGAMQSNANLLQG